LTYLCKGKLVSGEGLRLLFLNVLNLFNLPLPLIRFYEISSCFFALSGSLHEKSYYLCYAPSCSYWGKVSPRLRFHGP
jgi:hypothetical protein